MLGTKAKPTSKASLAPTSNSMPSASSGASKATCVVADGTFIQGQFNSTENIRMDGKVKGEVKCSHRLVMGETGKIEGKIFTQDATIMGTIDGEINVKGTLHLMGTAKIYGIINAQFMIVDEGAVFIGECKVGKKLKN